MQDTIGRQELIGNNLTRLAGQRSLGIPQTDFTLANQPYGRESAMNLINQFGQMGDAREQAPYDPRNYGNLDQYDERVQDAFMAQQRRNLEPAFRDQYERQQQDLANRGLPVGGEAYNRASEALNRSQTDAWQNASNQAIMMAGQESDRQRAAEQGLRSQAMGENYQQWQQGQADLSNQLQQQQAYRQQGIQEDLLQRQQNAQEVASLLGASPNMPTPTAPNMPTYQMNAPDVIGAYNSAYQNQLSAHNANQQRQSSMWQGAANLAGTGASLMKSHPSYKEDDGPAERILDRVEQLPVRTWRYRRDIDPHQELHIGPYAHDWQRIMGIGNGTEINVIDAFGVVLKCIQELHDDNKEIKKKLRSRK